MMILIAVMLVGFMVTVAFSVDIAQMHLSRTELRTATDAAAKAAAVELSQSLDTTQAIRRGREIAAANTVSGAPLNLVNADFQFGRAEEDASGRFNFDSGGTPRNSVRVNGRKTPWNAVSSGTPI
ncbi:MAG: pilus assembly protein TadG-related protein [Planctomycetota bacterium]